MTIKWNDSKFKKAAKDEGTKRLLKAGFLVEGMAKRLAPVDTGRLRASISTNVTGGSAEGKIGSLAKKTILTNKRGGKSISRPVKGIKAPSTPFTVVVGTNVEYAKRLETGTTKMAARPFLRPALWGARATIQRIMNK